MAKPQPQDRAEAVETEAQLAFLESHGCDEIQGYLCSRAVAPEEFVGFLAGREREMAAGRGAFVVSAA